MWFELYLPSATKLRRLCFYTCLSVILFTGGSTGTPLTRDPPGTRYTPGTGRYTPWTRYTPSPQGPGTPPGSRQVPPQDQAGTSVSRTRQVYPRDQAGTPPRTRQVHPPPSDGYWCGRHASYWNAFLYWLNQWLSATAWLSTSALIENCRQHAFASVKFKLFKVFYRNKDYDTYRWWSGKEVDQSASIKWGSHYPIGQVTLCFSVNKNHQ